MYGKQPTYHGPDNVKLYIDVKDHDTPAIVEVGRYTATYDCAMDTGEMDCGAGPDLTQAQLDWLEQFRDEVNRAFDTARAGMREYGN